MTREMADGLQVVEAKICLLGVSIGTPGVGTPGWRDPGWKDPGWRDPWWVEGFSSGDPEGLWVE